MLGSSSTMVTARACGPSIAPPAGGTAAVVCVRCKDPIFRVLREPGYCSRGQRTLVPGAIRRRAVQRTPLPTMPRTSVETRAAQVRRRADQLGDRSDLHLAHHLRPMGLDGPHRRSDFEGDLLVELAVHDAL